METNGQLPTRTVNEFAPLDASILQAQVNAIQQAMKQVMKLNVHYGLIPGCGDKPALFKPGAEKLSMMFRLLPTIEVMRQDLANNHREYTVTVTLKNPHGQAMGQGVGSCSTMESKYRYRKGERKCPECGREAIIKGKAEYGGGWICFGKKGGCGAKFGEGDKAIEGQETGRVENPDIADQYNTVLKMAKKRGLVDAVLTATAASDIFAQDIEEGFDYPDEDDGVDQRPENESPAAPKMKAQYNIGKVPQNKREETIAYLKGQRATTEDPELNLWESPKVLEPLAKFRVGEAIAV